MNKRTNYSALVFSGLSLLAAVLFLGTTISGDYTVVERVGGAVWVFILSMIITMPLVTGFFKKKTGS